MNICFVTSELAPHTPGGAGRVIAGLLDTLQEAGHRTRALLVTEEFTTIDDPRVEVVVAEAHQHRFVGLAQAAAAAAARLAPGVDLFEFQDFQGLAYWTLMRRRSLGLEETTISLRAHGPIDLISDHVAKPDPAQEYVRVMEQQAFAMADFVLASSAPVAQELHTRYGLEAERVVVAEPPVEVIPGETKLRRAANPEIAFFGTLAEVKGAEDFVQAAVQLAPAHESAMFRLMGADGWHSDGQAMTEYLRAMIPPRFEHQFRFEGASDREEIGTALATAWAVATPSRYETFCLAAHEARHLGLPVIVPDLPAFRPYFSLETGALVYTGLEGLQTAMEQALTQPPLLDQLGLAPPPAYGDPTNAYEGELPPRRHPRAQAGLATAALARLEEALAPPPPPDPPELHTRVARWLNRLPFPVARWVSDVIPEGHPYRSLAAWHDAFREKQPEIERRRRLVSSARRHKPKPARVTVVIACFNQGEYVEDAIYSVLEQTMPDWEIIVVNDGSDDPATTELLAGLNLPRVRVINQPNAGLPAARNRGMREAATEFLVPLDADDELTPRFLERLIEALEQSPKAGVAHCWTRLFGDLNQVWVPPPLNPYRLLLSNSLVGCAVVRTEAWRQVGGYDEAMTLGNEDWDFWLRMLSNEIPMVEVPEPLFRYRRHGITMSVETEARFEQARREVSRAHPELYGRIEAIKQASYPAVSVLVGSSADRYTLAAQDFIDTETLEFGADEDLPGSVHGASGKYVIVWDHVAEAGPGDLALLARHLEADDGAYAAGPSRDQPILWRRWSMVDPHTTHDRVAVVPGTLAVGKVGDFLGAFPQERYLYDDEVDVVQVSPEAEVRIPEWVR